MTIHCKVSILGDMREVRTQHHNLLDKGIHIKRPAYILTALLSPQPQKCTQQAQIARQTFAPLSCGRKTRGCGGKFETA